MPEDDKSNIENVVDDLLKNINEGVGNVIDGFGTTITGKVRASPYTVKDAIAKSPQIREMLEKFVKSYEQNKAQLTAELESLRTQASTYEEQNSELTQEARDLEGQVSQLQETYKPFLTAFVEIIPEDLLESWASKLYKSDPQNSLLEAMEPRLYKLEEARIELAKDEDKNRAVEIGTVTGYSLNVDLNIGVAEIQVSGPSKLIVGVGEDWVRIKGPETDFMQPITTMSSREDHATGKSYITLNVQNPVKEGDIVYKMV